MKRIDRLKENLAKVGSQQMALYRSGQLMKGQRLDAKVKELESLIKEAEAYEPRKLSELIDKETLKEHRLAEQMVKLHLVADFLCDCGFDLRESLNKLGLADCSLFPLVDEITKKASAFASLVCHPEFAGLQDFIINNEEYIEASHKLTEEYINKHLVIT